MTEASPDETYFSESVTPPFPPSSRQAPMIKAVRQFASDSLGAPRQRAIAYMIIPARKKRVPAMSNGGIVWIARRIPR